MVEFEYVNRMISTGYEMRDPGFKLPIRSTENSAGYDFFAPEQIRLPAKTLTRVMTGVKCKLDSHMYLLLTNRSSNPSKKGLFLANGVGIVDADYYNNPDNEGEIGFEFYNFKDTDIIIEKNEKIGQGIISTYFIVKGDNATGSRIGGFGSTGK